MLAWARHQPEAAHRRLRRQRRLIFSRDCLELMISSRRGRRSSSSSTTSRARASGAKAARMRGAGDRPSERPRSTRDGGPRASPRRHRRRLQRHRRLRAASATPDRSRREGRQRASQIRAERASRDPDGVSSLRAAHSRRAGLDTATTAHQVPVWSTNGPTWMVSLVRRFSRMG